MIIALPLTANDAFSPHYGASAKVGLFEVDPERRTLVGAIAMVPPAPEPCGWADWLNSQGVKVFLAGGMGDGARQRMAAVGINVIVGMPAAAPITLVRAWLDGTLTAGENACEGGDHGQGHHEHHEGPGDGPHEGHGCCGSH